MNAKQIVEDEEAQAAAWHELVMRWRGKKLLPGISREQFEASMKLGFDEAWEVQRKRAAGAAI